MPVLSSHGESKDVGLKTIEVVRPDAEFLQNLLKGELQRSRALVEISNLRKHAGKGDPKAVSRPLIDRLSQYPSEGVDLENIVTYPPKMEPIPVKPLFLDVAWNYVQYPQKQGAQTKTAGNKASSKAAEPEQPSKKGWFGFGRS
jgi:signal recognition particle subunit SRP68